MVGAARECGLLVHPSCSDIQLHLGDALTYRRPASSDPFDVVFVDIFDGDNLLPKEFYSKEFLDHVFRNHLGGLPGGMVVHNFHTGGKALGSQLEDAVRHYRSAFSTTLAVVSIDSRHTGGNTIVLATNKRRLDASSETLSWYAAAGTKAQNRYGVGFDIFARSTQKLWLS